MVDCLPLLAYHIVGHLYLGSRQKVRNQCLMVLLSGYLNSSLPAVSGYDDLLFINVCGRLLTWLKIDLVNCIWRMYIRLFDIDLIF